VIGHLYQLLFVPAPAPPPTSGPSGGLSWLRDYTPRFDHAAQLQAIEAQAQRDERRRADELAIVLMAPV
jgi:hypothetical protein